MNRRNFLRVSGGGVIFAATQGLSGCSPGMPPAAVQAWLGPQQESDVRRWALGWALLAPHSHNLQSWLVNLSQPGEIVLHCDLTRLLPQTDPLARQIMMSQGTFIELLDIAARERGQRCEVSLFPDGVFGPDKPDSRPVARIRLVDDPTVARDPLFAQVAHRRTNRSLYDPTRAVPAPAWQAMAQAVQPHALRLGFVGLDDAAALQRHRAIAATAWRVELTTPRTILESFKVMRVGAAEIDRHRDGLSLLDAMPVALNALGLFDRAQAPAPDSFVTTGQIKQFGQKLDSTPAFLWLVSQGNDRITQVNAGRAFARIQLAATAQGLAMQPLSQALQEYPEQAGPYGDIHQLLQAPPAQQTVQMWARVGYAPEVGPAPRRSLDSHILKT